MQSLKLLLDAVQSVLTAYQKQIEVVFLLGVLLVMDHLNINDQYVRYTVMGLIGGRTGWHGFNALVNMANGSNSQPPAPPAP